MNFDTQELNNVIGFLIDIRDSLKDKEYTKRWEDELKIKRKVEDKPTTDRIRFMDAYLLDEPKTVVVKTKDKAIMKPAPIRRKKMKLRTP